MNSQTTTLSPSTETAGNVPTRPRERGLEGIDVRPVLRRLSRMTEKPWGEVRAKIHGLSGMRYEATRTAYLRCLDESVANDANVLPAAPFYVDDGGLLARRGQIQDDKPARPVVLSTETEEFLDRRVVGIRGTALVWFVRTGRSYQVPNGIDPETSKPIFRDVDYFRQSRPLNKKEILSFNAVPETERDEILSLAPVFSPSPAN